MKRIWLCRRTFITLAGLLALLALGLKNNLDVSLAIAGCVAAICGANAMEAMKRPEGGGE